jgi:hypothetical protein
VVAAAVFRLPGQLVPAALVAVVVVRCSLLLLRQVARILAVVAVVAARAALAVRVL